MSAFQFVMEANVPYISRQGTLGRTIPILRRNILTTLMILRKADAQDRDLRFPNDPIAFAVVPQMASPRAVSDDQDVSLRLLCRSVQQLRNIAAIDDDFGLRAHVLLKLGDLFDGVADDHLLPHGVA